MPRRQLQEKRRQSQPIAIFYFSHRCHKQPYPAPNAFMAQLKFRSRLSILRRVQAAGAGAVGGNMQKTFNAKTPRRKDAKNSRNELPSQPVTKKRLGFFEVFSGSALCAIASLR
jgi:hypothetical protein